MQLKDKTYFVSEQAQQIAMTIDLRAIDGNVTLVWRVETAKQMEKCALAATRWAA